MNPKYWLLGPAGAATSTGIRALLPAVGFTAGGVKAGSLAAGMHASIGAVKAGSVFATAQSLGATGAFAGPASLLAGIAIGLGTGKMINNHLNENRKWE